MHQTFTGVGCNTFIYHLLSCLFHSLSLSHNTFTDHLLSGPFQSHSRTQLHTTITDHSLSGPFPSASSLTSCSYSLYTDLSSPGLEMPMNLQMMGLALNWEMFNCTVTEAVWNSNGAKVTVISTSLLAGTIPVQHRVQSESAAHVHTRHRS